MLWIRKHKAYNVLFSCWWLYFSGGIFDFWWKIL